MVFFLDDELRKGDLLATDLVGPYGAPLTRQWGAGPKMVSLFTIVFFSFFAFSFIFFAFF
jgi:hypothetical protein